MEKQSFIQKHGRYIIDYAVIVLSIAAVIDYYVRGESHHTIEAAFALVALYAFVVTQRLKSLQKKIK